MGPEQTMMSMHTAGQKNNKKVLGCVCTPLGIDVTGYQVLHLIQIQKGPS